MAIVIDCEVGDAGNYGFIECVVSFNGTISWIIAEFLAGSPTFDKSEEQWCFKKPCFDWRGKAFIPHIYMEKAAEDLHIKWRGSKRIWCSLSMDTYINQLAYIRYACFIRELQLLKGTLAVMEFQISAATELDESRRFQCCYTFDRIAREIWGTSYYNWTVADVQRAILPLMVDIQIRNNAWQNLQGFKKRLRR